MRGINKALLNNIKLFSLSAILFTITFSWLNINSVVIMLLSATWLLEGQILQKLGKLKKDKLFLAYALYFVLQALGTFLTTDPSNAWKYTESQVGLIVIPIILCSTEITTEIRDKTMMAFTISLTVASLFCIAYLLYHNINHLTPALFFYHSLVSPLSHHAIYFSIFIFSCILYLLYEKIPTLQSIRHKRVYMMWILYFIAIIILLSSKLVLSFLFLFLLFFITKRSYRKKRLWPAIVLSSIVILFTTLLVVVDNPVKERFQNVLQGHMELVKKEKFDPATPFTGLNLRLIFWRFSYEILHEQSAFLFGVGPANTQPLLNQKYISMNMYLGNNKGDTGFLGYDCHNQLLQSALGLGITGIVFFLFWCVMLFKKTAEKKSPVVWGTVLIIFSFFAVESVFSVQYGIILCTVLPLLLLYSRPTNSQ